MFYLPCIIRAFFLSLYLKISKYLSTILVVLLLTDIAGFALWDGARAVCYHYVRNHRQEIAMRDTIAMPVVTYKAGNTYTRHKRDEIAYHGQMFDIKKELVRGEIVLLIGHYDKFENKLFKLLHNLLDDNEDGESNGANRSIWSIDAIISTPLQLTLYSFAVDKSYFNTNSDKESTKYFVPLIAPPDKQIS